ncbi:hypothetical protein EMCRGX_G006350 [Ephydatia muelleri]
MNDVVDTIVFVKGEDRSDFSVVVAKLDVLCALCSSKHVTRDKFFHLRQSGDYLKLGKPRQEHSSITLTMYDGSVRRSMGKCTLQLAAETISQLEFEVLDTKHHSLLSMDTCLELGVLKYNTEEVGAPTLSAPEEFQRRLQAALQGLDGVEVVADDVLVYGSGTIEKEARISHDERLAKLLQRAREDMISQEQLLTFYDVRKPVVIQCDASTESLVATLLQDRRPVVAVSRSLTKSEHNYMYVALELECLAVVFVCQKFDQHMYMYGNRVTVETDHKPLEAIIKKSLLAAPRWLKRMLLQLQWYDLNIPGSQVVADTLSRANVEAAPEDIACRDEVLHLGLKDAVFKELKVISDQDFILISDMRLTAVKEAAKKNVEQTELWKVISRICSNGVFLRPSRHQPYVDADDRMSDQGPTKVLPVSNVGNPALEMTELTKRGNDC